jgi:hypothetical protein
MALLPAPPQPPHKCIEELGAKLAEFVVKHPKTFSDKEVEDAQSLSSYLRPFAYNVFFPCGTLSELQLYIDCKVVENLTNLLDGLFHVCNGPMFCDDLCKKALPLYASAFAALTRIAELARALATQPCSADAEGKVAALKFLDQLQPEKHEQAPGMLQGLGAQQVYKSCRV